MESIGCKPKELGWVLAIDQASNQAGVSLWRNGRLIAVTVLASESASHKFSRRIQHQLPQLTAFLDAHLGPSELITKVVFEGVRARLVLITVGSFLCCPRIDAIMHQYANFVESTSWKVWARNHGAQAEKLKDIKGIKALGETGFPLLDITSDDVADSILIYLTWRDRRD